MGRLTRTRQPLTRTHETTMFFHLILTIVLISFIVRLITRPFHHRYYYGYDNPYRYGCRRHHRFFGRILPILALVALDRVFTRRY